MIVNLTKDFMCLDHLGSANSNQADVIMVTCGKDEESRKLTMEALNSLRDSEPEGTFHVIVAEKDPSCPDYPQADLTLRVSSTDNIQCIYNKAIKCTRMPYIVLCHPDVVFHKNWWTHLHNAMQSHILASASPRCPSEQLGVTANVNRLHITKSHEKILIGHDAQLLVCGWCLALRRSVLRAVFPLDEDENYFTQEHEFAQKLAAARLRHGLVGVSTVTHRGDKPKYIEVKQDGPIAKWSKKESYFENPKIEIILTTCKRHDALMSAIHSIQNQTRQDWIMHIVSDGEDPDLKQLLAPYLSSKIKISFIEGPNKDWGFKATNYGLFQCEAPYVLLMSDDNYYMPTFLEQMLGASEKYNLDFVHCHLLHNYNNYVYDPDFTPELMRGRMDKGQFVVRTDIAKKAGGLVGHRSWEDGLFIERIAEQNPTMRVMGLNQCLFVHN